MSVNEVEDTTHDSTSSTDDEEFASSVDDEGDFSSIVINMKMNVVI